MKSQDTSLPVTVKSCSLEVDMSYVSEETYKNLFFESLFTGTYASGSATIDVNGKSFTIDVSFYEWIDKSCWGDELFFSGLGPDGDKLINYFIEHFGVSRQEEKEYIFSEVKGERDYAKLGIGECEFHLGDNSPACAVLNAVNHIQDEILKHVWEHVYWPQVVGSLINLQSNEGIDDLIGEIIEDPRSNSESILKERFNKIYENLYGESAPDELVEYFVSEMNRRLANNAYDQHEQRDMFFS